jgi:hypothetical protein
MKLALCLAVLLVAVGAGPPAAAADEMKPADGAPAVGSSAPAAPAFTKEIADAVASQKIAMDTLWTMIAAFLVFFEPWIRPRGVGLCRARTR